jgi:hypothetical protein
MEKPSPLSGGQMNVAGSAASSAGCTRVGGGTTLPSTRQDSQPAQSLLL